MRRRIASRADLLGTRAAVTSTEHLWLHHALGTVARALGTVAWALTARLDEG
ncbi:hypothetical protein ACFWNL_27980 [Kitasatospora sp. NPDC058397]|uniref:hypothetical protein n=1 Tax=unclassified Kitasatospora TaxID=2633591 RepID=UPI0036662401